MYLWCIYQWWKFFSHGQTDTHTDDGQSFSGIRIRMRNTHLVWFVFLLLTLFHHSLSYSFIVFFAGPFQLFFPKNNFFYSLFLQPFRVLIWKGRQGWFEMFFFFVRIILFLILDWKHFNWKLFLWNYVWVVQTGKGWRKSGQDDELARWGMPGYAGCTRVRCNILRYDIV